jgi:cell fate (sporulation/competence/biofilm development) regulator YmcA (YheA/YmcA/DUF963 family)
MSQDLINSLIAVCGAGVGWLLKMIWDAIKTLQQDIKEMERELHTAYVAKDDYRKDLVEIKDMLKQIFDKMDKKADK